METKEMYEFNFWMASYRRYRAWCVYAARCIRRSEWGSAEWVRCHRLLDDAYACMLNAKNMANNAFVASV